MRTGIGLAAAAFVLAVTFGATTRAEGWGTLAPIVCSVLVFSGSAQFALTTALAGGGGVAPAVASAALINGRFLPMGMAVTPSLPGGAHAWSALSASRPGGSSGSRIRSARSR